MIISSDSTFSKKVAKTNTKKITPLAGALMALSARRSVIPVGQDKIPLVSWKKYQEVLPTKAQIESWWKEYPKANLGIVTGKISNLTVVDVENGGDIKKFPRTLTVQTGGGGWHLYYKYYPIQNKTRIFPLTDVRGDGGYVVAPGSTHASGKLYEIIDDFPIRDFPYELFGEKKVSKVLEKIEGVEEGDRNASAATVAGGLLRVFNKQKAVAWTMLSDWNKKNIPPLSEYELRNVFNSIASREDRKDHNGTSDLPDPTVEPLKYLTMSEVLEEADIELENTKPEDIVSFGYDFLDENLTGLFKGELVILGGESGTGKTTFATNIIYKASKKYKCCIYALEDRLVDYGIKSMFFEVNRLRTKDGRKSYPWNDYRRNQISDPNFKELKKQAKENLRNENILFVKAVRQMDIETLEREVDLKVKEGVQLFLIDHLHYFDLLKGNQSKADYIENMMVRIKSLLNRTGARTILVVHYKKLEGKKPMLDSFKDSIAIPQNANYVINLWRDRSDSGDRLKTLLTVPKSRNPNGEFTLELEFDPNKNDYKLINQKYGTPQDKEFEDFTKKATDNF